jgi:probable HAF family extracellular repeat protein
MPVGMTAQDDEGQHHKPRHHTYKLIDLGTFGGPNSLVNGPTVPILSNNGTYAGEAEASIPDPYAPHCQNGDCLIQHAQRWRNGVVTDLGTLPGTNLNSGATWVSASGIIVGESENGLIDPLGIPEMRAVRWTRDGKIDLGTLEGGHQSFANMVNDQKQVGGWSTNTIADPFSMAGLGYQIRGFLLHDGVMEELGTLGGPDALPEAMNERGQIIGNSYTSSSPNASTGIPTIDPFIWKDGRMVDIGSFGGTFGVANFINNRGEVVGISNLPGDTTHHPFLWRRGILKDLGTLGGANGDAAWINDAGDIAGRAEVSGGASRHAFLWKDGVMIDLGLISPWTCSTALSVNASDQTVGETGICGVGGGPGFLWERNEPMVDLNLLVFPMSDIEVADPYDINDRGEIAAAGFLPNGDERAVLPIPIGDCDDACEARITASQNHTALAAQPNSSTRATIRNSETEGAPINSMRYRFAQRSHIPDQSPVPLK